MCAYMYINISLEGLRYRAQGSRLFGRSPRGLQHLYNIYTCVTCVYIYIYICIERERNKYIYIERERDR